MCGIAGIFAPGTGPASLQTVKRMLQLIKHRGPDNEGTYFSTNIALGHVRLSILDLTAAGRQPMQLANQDLWITFNGEIYNYVELRHELEALGAGPFVSQSDTEVLLWAYKEWGTACLPKLNGMFAFAIWDGNSSSLFCARDRFGVKPFFYRADASGFAFASEIKALTGTGIAKATPNLRVLKQYLLHGSYGAPEETFFAGIQSLAPGHSLLVDREGVRRISAYWTLTGPAEPDIHEPGVAQKRYFDLLIDSIRLRLRSDVTVGLCLSGGLDSSVLLGTIHHHLGSDNRLRAYTFTCGHPDYDESQYARELLSGTLHPWEQCMLGVQEFWAEFGRMQVSQDEPFGGLPTMAYGKIFRRAREQNVIVVLDGQGMDEQWGGYDYYQKALLTKTSNGDIAGIPTVQGSDAVQAPQVLTDDFLHGTPNGHQTYPHPFADALRNLKYRDLMYTKIPRALRFGDRLSMAASVELREPFLDYRLVELSFRFAPDLLIHEGVRKYTLRHIARTMLPVRLVDSPKRPLQTPQREWLRDELREGVQDIIHSQSLKDRGIFDSNKIATAYREYCEGACGNSFFLWQWLNTEMWFRCCVD